MRSALLVGLMVGSVGCAFPTEKFILGMGGPDAATDAAVTGDADVAVVDVAVVDAAPDVTAVDAAPDVTAVDAAPDVTAIDAAPDVLTDLDVGVDVGVDAGDDVGDDVTDAGLDAPSTDVGVDIGVDVPVDVATDVPRDTGVDVPVDVAMDVPRDAGVDVPVDVPTDTGPPACRTTLPYCASPTVCAAGFCVASCPSGQVACSGACVDLRADVTNCGACGRSCPSYQACLAGACVTQPGSYVFTRATAPFIDACAMMTVPHLLAGQDDVVGAPLTLPFAFNFAGVGYSTLRPSSNGYIVFGATAEANDNNYYPNAALPDPIRPRPAVFALNSDLYQRTTAGICFAVVGAAPTRRAVIEWQDTAMCCGDTNPAHLTFELVLNEVDRSLDIIFQTLTYQPGDGRNWIVGMQNELATVGTTFLYSPGALPTTVAVGTSLHAVPAPP